MTTPNSNVSPAQATVSTWCVWIQGMDEVLPAADRRDAYQRAHTTNQMLVDTEIHRTPASYDEYLPRVWAVPCQYGPHSPAGSTSPYPPNMTVEQIDAEWERWAQ